MEHRSVIQFNSEQLKLVQATVAKGTSTEEFRLFIEVCKYHNTILYNPAEEAAKVQMSGFFAALASFVEQDAERVQQSHYHFIIEQSFKMEQVVPSPEEVLEFIKVNRPDVAVSLDEVRRAMEILDEAQP